MVLNAEEMRLRDIAIGSKTELTEALYQRKKADLVIAELRNEIHDLEDRHRAEQMKLLQVIATRDAEITAIRHSHTWKIGSLVLAPLRWIKRSKR
jgi:hypothetical protein